MFSSRLSVPFWNGAGTKNPRRCAVTAPTALHLKIWIAFVRPSAATILSFSVDTAVLLWVILYIRLSLLSLRLSFRVFQGRSF